MSQLIMVAVEQDKNLQVLTHPKKFLHFDNTDL